MNTEKLLALKASIKPVGKIDAGNPLDAIDVPEFRDGYQLPPGMLGDLICEIEQHFERREEGESFRLAGAICLAQLIAGRNIIGPTESKCAFNIFMIASSGGGKGDMIKFVEKYADKLGISSRLSSSTMTSTKQIKMALIEAGGFLLYVADDCPEHLQLWSDARSSLGDTSSWFRASATGDWTPEMTIRSAFAEELQKAQQPKLINAASVAEGWRIPRVNDSDEGPIDYVKLSRMNNETGKRLKHCMQAYELSSDKIKNIRFIPLVTVTPDQGLVTVRKWRADGGMGRSLFIRSPEYIPQMKAERPDLQVSTKIINEIKPRIPTSIINVKFKSKEVADYYDLLAKKIDEARNIEGIAGHMGARYGQMVIDLATICAFMDMSSRDGMNPYIQECHLEWAYGVAMKSLYDAREYLEGEAEFDGLENTEWDNLVKKVQKWTESKLFEKPYISGLKNKICRDKVSKIIAAADSNSLQMNPDRFTYELVMAIYENKNSPIMLDPDNPTKIILASGGSWSGLRMNSTMRNILSAALKRMRFMRNIK